MLYIYIYIYIYIYACPAFGEARREKRSGRTPYLRCAFLSTQEGWGKSWANVWFWNDGNVVLTSTPKPSWLAPPRVERYAHPNTGVCEKTLLSCEPLPCNSAAEAALQTLIWLSESLSSYMSSSPEECYFHRHRYFSLFLFHDKYYVYIAVLFLFLFHASVSTAPQAMIFALCTMLSTLCICQIYMGVHQNPPHPVRQKGRSLDAYTDACPMHTPMQQSRLRSNLMALDCPNVKSNIPGAMRRLPVSKDSSLIFLPDPGALHSCIAYISREKYWIRYALAHDSMYFGYGIWDPRIVFLRIEVMRTDHFINTYIYIYIWYTYIYIYIYRERNIIL